MNKEEKKQKLLNLRHVLIDYLFENINDNKKIKDYFTQYLNFTTFEIDDYYKLGNYEYVTFELAAQNTGNIFFYRYDIKNDEYMLCRTPVIFTSKVDNFDISKEILKEIFDIARENQTLLQAEKELTEKVIKIKSIS